MLKPAATQDEQTQATYDMDTKTRDVSKADEQGSQVTQYLVGLFVVVVGFVSWELAKDRWKKRDHAVLNRFAPRTNPNQRPHLNA